MCWFPSALAAAADDVLVVLGGFVAAALRGLLLVSGQQGFDFRRDFPLIHGRAPLFVLHNDITDDIIRTLTSQAHQRTHR